MSYSTISEALKARFNDPVACRAHLLEINGKVCVSFPPWRGFKRCTFEVTDNAVSVLHDPHDAQEAAQSDGNVVVSGVAQEDGVVVVSALEEPTEVLEAADVILSGVAQDADDVVAS